MLVQAGFMEPSLAVCILTALDKLQVDGFSSIAQLPAPRGVYLAYEEYLRTTIGAEAGNLHLGRSRNDINATLLKLKLRNPYISTTNALVELLRTLCQRGHETLDTEIPLHTHRQPAVPSTVAHHLAGFAMALSRDLDAIISVAPGLDSCCLGAGAGGGTTLAIKTDVTARLLGFSKPSVNSIDAVASRDLVLRSVAACSILGSNLGRIAETLFIWLGDSGLACLPDELVGSSSAMPHKRNAFLLEHVQGKVGAITGSLVAGLTAMQAAPFTNCIAVGTEGAGHIWSGIDATEAAVRLMRLCIAGLTFSEDTSATLLDKSFVNAMEAATCLAVGSELDFRAAHNVVGRLVTEAIEEGTRTITDTSSALSMSLLTDNRETLAPSKIVASTCFGGGCAPETVAASFNQIENHIAKISSQLTDLETQWHMGHVELRNAIAELESQTH